MLVDDLNDFLTPLIYNLFRYVLHTLYIRTKIIPFISYKPAILLINLLIDQMKTLEVVDRNLEETLSEVYLSQLCILEYFEMGLFEESPLFHLGKFFACDVLCTGDKCL